MDSIPGSRSVLLVNHGQLRTLDQGSVDQWREWGQSNQISILLHNYPGYGKTPGPVTPDRILADLEQLVDMWREKWKEHEICLLGNSAGKSNEPRSIPRANGGQDVGQQSLWLLNISSEKSF